MTEESQLILFMDEILERVVVRGLTGGELFDPMMTLGEKEAARIGGLTCSENAWMLVQSASEAGRDAVIVAGLALPPPDERGARRAVTAHVWGRVDGVDYDPTWPRLGHVPEQLCYWTVGTARVATWRRAPELLERVREKAREWRVPLIEDG